MARLRSRILLTMLVALLSVVMVPIAIGQPDDTLSIDDGSGEVSNTEIALRVAEQTFSESNRVLISRDDGFADALASGLLQHDAPLLLVPTTGPLPTAVTERIEALGATEAVILGGEVAISTGVQTELESRGLDVSRREGDSRFETAVDVAATDAPGATTAMLARAFQAPGGPESQAFADTLAAGGISAREGFPMLLSETDRLTASTRDYVSSSAIERVLVMGGTAAISSQTEAELAALGVEVERISGLSRADTAKETAKIAGDESAADAARVIITEGEGEDAWARGFALASHAAVFDAPILLALDRGLAPETEAFLQSGIGGDPAVAPVLTCAVDPTICETARVDAGLPPQPVARFEDVGPFSIALSDGSVERHTFEGKAGDLVAIGYRNLLPVTPAENACADVSLLAPDAAVLQSLDNGFSNCSEQLVDDARLDPVTLPVDGTYVLETASENGVDGSVDVYASGVTSVVTEVGAPPLDVALDRPGQGYRATFQATAGQRIGIGYRNLLADAAGQNACIELELIAPNNDRVATITNGFSNCSEQLVDDGLSRAARLPVDGTYILEAYFNLGTPGSADPYVTDAEEATTSPGGSRYPVALDRPGAIHEGTFTGTAEDLVTIGYTDLAAVSSSQDVCIELELLAPSGEAIASLTNGFSNCTEQNTSDTADTVALPVTGQYILKTSFDNGRSGSATVVLN